MTDNALAVCFLAALILLPVIAMAQDSAKSKNWWEKRKARSDIFYPHNAHAEAMREEGDACLLCHPFSRNTITDEKKLGQLTVIANEPLQAICHSCHLQRRTAPPQCRLCHQDMAAIWPPNHDFDYRRHHALDAQFNAKECESCHVDVTFCSDCHFRRQSSIKREHAAGYLGMHGIDARLNSLSCSRCHNAGYCTDCHRDGIR
jgi:hypothetical protein